MRADELRRHSSTRRPTIARGDRALLYAAGWQVLFAVVEITGDPEHDPTRVRWAWSVPLRAELALRDLREGVPVEAAGISPRSLGRHSYVRLTPEGFETGADALASAL